MFKKLVSNLPFNPSLINQISFYARRLHREASIRRLGFVFIAMAMFVQIFAIVAPPKPTLARVGNDLIPGGFGSHREAINHCNANSYGFSTILGYFGVSCSALASGTVRRMDYAEYGGSLYSMGRVPYGFSRAVG